MSSTLFKFVYDISKLQEIIESVQVAASDLPIPAARKSRRAVNALLGFGVNHQKPDGMGHFYFFGPLGSILCQLEIYFIAHSSLRRTDLLPYVIRIQISEFSSAPVLNIEPTIIDGKWVQDAGVVSIVRKSVDEYGILMPILQRLKGELRDQHLDAYRHLEIKKAEAEKGSPLEVSYEMPTEEEMEESRLRDEAILREANWPSD